MTPQDSPYDLSLYEPAVLAYAAGAIGGPGLPYPAMPYPPYRTIQQRGWAFRTFFLPACPGYFNGVLPMTWETGGLYRDGVNWMSLVPMEIESQMPHLAAASGHVVVCGMGMGLISFAMAAKRSVTRLTIIDRDPEVIEMAQEFSDMANWPHRDKITILQGDARTVQVEAVDFLYADIWPYYRMDCMVPDMQSIARHIPAPRCGYWGQELDMVDAAVARGVPVGAFSDADIDQFRAETGLALIGQEVPGYAALCRQVAQNPMFNAGRQPSLTPAQKAAAEARLDAGEKPEEVAQAIGVSFDSLRRGVRF